MKQQIQKNHILAVGLDEMQIKPKSVPGSANQIVFKDNYVDSRAITIFKHDSTLRHILSISFGNQTDTCIIFQKTVVLLKFLLLSKLF